MPDTATPDLIQEVYILDFAGIRRRVYRGKNPKHIAWKLAYHAKHDPRVITPDPSVKSALAAWPGDELTAD